MKEHKIGITYKPLRITLVEKDLNITGVCKALGISSPVRSKLSNDSDYVSLKTIERICVYLDVPIEKVVKISK